MIERANPALQETDKVLAILADQNKGLAQLAVDSDTVLGPLARERDHIAGFINNATIAGEAAAERRNDIEQGFQSSSRTALKQLQSTMVQLRRFAEAGDAGRRRPPGRRPEPGRRHPGTRPFADAGTPGADKPRRRGRGQRPRPRRLEAA